MNKVYGILIRYNPQCEEAIVRAATERGVIVYDSNPAGDRRSPEFGSGSFPPDADILSGRRVERIFIFDKKKNLLDFMGIVLDTPYTSFRKPEERE